MTTEVWVALIAMTGTAVTSIVAAIVAIRTKTKVDETKNEIAGMHTSVNSKMDKLLQVATELARIEGRDAERAAVMVKETASKEAFKKGVAAAKKE